MTNSKAVRAEILKRAGWELSNGKWAHKHTHRASQGEPNVCFTCKSCWRRSLQSDLDDLRCPFCGSAMYEARQ